jgi:hypothetical protein
MIAEIPNVRDCETWVGGQWIISGHDLIKATGIHISNTEPLKVGTQQIGFRETNARRRSVCANGFPKSPDRVSLPFENIVIRTVNVKV